VKSSYFKLHEELQKTSVISKEFKDKILGYASMIAQEAYDKGKQEGRNEPA